MIYPLDLQMLLINTFAGNIVIFGIISLLFIIGVSAYFRMPTLILMPILVLYIVMLGSSGYFEGLYALTILIVAVVIGLAIKSFLNK